MNTETNTTPKRRSNQGRTRRTVNGKVVLSPSRTPGQQKAVEKKLAAINPADFDVRGLSLSELRRRAEAKLFREGQKLLRR